MVGKKDHKYQSEYPVVKGGRNTTRTRQASHVKHVTPKNKCGTGKQGLASQNATGLEGG